jgi:hypothetical protein
MSGYRSIGLATGFHAITDSFYRNSAVRKSRPESVIKARTISGDRSRHGRGKSTTGCGTRRTGRCRSGTNVC